MHTSVDVLNVLKTRCDATNHCCELLAVMARWYDVRLSHLLQSHLLVKYFSLLFILLKAFVLVGMWVSAIIPGSLQI